MPVRARRARSTVFPAARAAPSLRARKIRAPSAATPAATLPSIRAGICRARLNTPASRPPARQSPVVATPRTLPTSSTTTTLPLVILFFLFSTFPLRLQRLRAIFSLLFSPFPETKNHTSPVWCAPLYSSQIPETLAPNPYSSRPLKRSLLVQARDASLGESPIVFHRASPADRKSTRLNSSHVAISYAVFCLKKKKK